MRYLITGSSGFLGQALTERLLENGHEVVLLGRNEPEGSQSANFVTADITDVQSLKDCREKIGALDGIIHLAAYVPKNKSEDQPQRMLEVNVQGTLNILEVFANSTKNFVYASTAEVYGLPSSSERLSEDSSVPSPLSFYGASKLAGELICNVYADHHELNVAILRFTVLYGSRDQINRAIPNFIKDAITNRELKVFGGEELRDYLHVSDAAEALFLAATKHPSGIFNIGTGKGISIRDTAKVIAKAASPEARIKIEPRQKKAADIVLNVDKAHRFFGFTAKYNFPDLIDEQIKWHKNNS